MSNGKSRRGPPPPEPDGAEDQDTLSALGASTPKASFATWDGPALRAAREKRGMAIEEMSNRTKINIAILRALEDERFEDTPKARVYVRGFVRCMAEEIGLDPDAVAKSYLPRWELWFERSGNQL